MWYKGDLTEVLPCKSFYIFLVKILTQTELRKMHSVHCGSQGEI